MMDALITGAKGFIGRALLEKLEEMGQTTHRLDSTMGDIADKSTWMDLPPAQTVYHLAARSFVPDSWKGGNDFLHTNVLGTENAIDYCRKHKARLVLASTYIYGSPEQLPVSEQHPLHPNNPYALSKYMAEKLCDFAATYYGVNAVALRLFNVFGPHQRRDFLIPTIWEQIKKRKEICVKDLNPKRDYVYINDVVDAFIATKKAQTGFHAINIGSGKSYSVQQIIDVIQAAAGTNLLVVSENQERREEIPNVMADITQAQNALRWIPRYSLEEGIKDMIQKDAAL